MVKAGYKQTEIGIIPKDWDYLELPQITQNSSNSIKIGPFGSALKKELLTKSGFKVYGQENIFEKNMQIGDRYVNQEHFNKLKSCEIKTNDFLVSMMGTIGKCFIVPENFEEGIIDSHLIRIRINETKYNLQLLTHIFGSEFILRQINQLTVGGIMDGLSSKIIKKLYLPIPPREEQKAIANALSDMDALITSLEKLIAKKESIKTATMQQLLTGEKRLDGFSGKWEEQTLGDLFHITAGGDLKKNQYADIQDNKYKFPIYANSIFNNGIYGFSTFKEYDGDCITVTARGTLGVAFFRNTPFVAIGRLIILSPKSKIDCFCITQMINNNLNFANESTSVPQLTAPQIAQYNLTIPSFEEQQAIAQILSDMDNEIEALKTKLSKTKAMKDGMMSELLSGKTRLKV